MATQAQLDALKQETEDYLAVLKTRLDELRGKVNAFSGEPGSVLFADQSNVAGSLIPGFLINSNPAVVESVAEQDLLKGNTESFSEVFSSWYRFSHSGSSGNYPANETELTAWEYDSQNDQIRCTQNTNTLVGFVSPTKHTDFVFEVELDSTAGDDDLVGVCFGFVTVDGVEHTLTAIRTPGSNIGGATHLFNVKYDFNNNGQVIDLGSTNGGLKWGDGVVDDSRTVANGGYGGWDTQQPCRIRIQRQGDIITLDTTNFGETSYVPTAQVVVNLNDYAATAKFKGASSYGYVCMSQDQSTWSTLKRPVNITQIVDIENNTIWNWNGSSWVEDTSSQPLEQFSVGRLYYNQSTRRLHYMDPNLGLIRIKAA